MTAEQIRLVRDLRSFESPVCMEAAREIERQAGTIIELREDAARLERQLLDAQNTISDLKRERVDHQ